MSDPGSGVSERWAEGRRGASLEDYERRWEQMEEAGVAAHGEADFVTSLVPRPSTVLDAGCGTGRLARELARRGVDVVGVDLDRDMLDHAARKARELTWVHGDLATVDLGRTFDAVVMAGNVMVFCRPEDRPRIVANLARHVGPAGVLVAGNTVGTTVGGFDPDEYDRDARAAGLVAEARFSTWERDPDDQGRYLVIVHRRPEPANPAG
jgi:SAM-dependent methyltransferase